jgi:hypothetical protein
MKGIKTYSTLIGTLATVFGTAHLIADNATVSFGTNTCPPNGYAYTNGSGMLVKPTQPPFDVDTNGDGTNDAWGYTITIPKGGGGNFNTTDACGNKLCLIGVPDPRGPGCGQDYFSPRFKAGGMGPGVEVGKCVYTCGRNTWTICFADANGDCVPDKFTKSCWESRDGGTGTDDWAFSGKIKTFCADLTKSKIAVVCTETNTMPRPAPGPTPSGTARGLRSRQAVPVPVPAPLFAIQAATIVDLGTDLATVEVGGEPVGGPGESAMAASEIAPSQETGEAGTVANTLELIEEVVVPGDIITAEGVIVNIDDVAHEYRFAEFAVNAEIIDGPTSIVLGPGEAASYTIMAHVNGWGDVGIFAFAHSETGDAADGSMGAAMVQAMPTGMLKNLQKVHGRDR